MCGNPQQTFIRTAHFLFLQDEQLGMQVDVHANNIVLVLHADLLLGVRATK